jgi:acyl-CoA synthetase (AMP-forming)/AMP-acid ligase II
MGGKLPDIFASKLELFAEATAIITHDGETVSYAALAALADAFGAQFPKNRKQVLLLAADNSLNALTAYLAALRTGVPVIFTPHDKPDTFANLQRQFSPTLTYLRVDGEYQFKHYPEHESKDHDFPEPLAVMISTSGSTGSTKLVKLSAANINANAKSISEYLELTPADRTMTTLPMFYSYGLSVINSYLTIGASLVLNEESVVDEGFWIRFNHYQCTGFAGVPYSYELLMRSGFEDKVIPTLRYMTVSGGKSAKELIEYFATLAQKRGWRFFPMYGQTEATSRMTYMPPEQVLAHCGSIGIPIPRGRIELIDENGQVVTGTNQHGEIVYYGPNVMMGYATKRDDLYDDAVLTKLYSGDIAWRDEGGFYFISGRKSRFLKIFGNRVGLDDLENALRAMGYVTICGGTDKHLIVMTIDQGKQAEIARILTGKFSLTSQYASVEEVKDFPLLPSGKIDYAKLVKMSEAKVLAESADQATHSKYSWRNLLGLNRKQEKLSAMDIFSKVFIASEVTQESSFESLNGDSLNYVQMMMLLEKKLGLLPANWQKLSVHEIEQLNIAPQSYVQTVETNVALRAFAILEVLLNHTYIVDNSYIVGGAALLMVLAGYSFARFQAASLFVGRVWSTIWPYLKKIIIPYLLICVFVVISRTVRNVPVHYDIFLMINNLYRLEDRTLANFWFIQVLTQCIVILGIVFSIKSFTKYAKDNVWMYSISLLSFFVLLCFLINSVWDTKALQFLVPHIYLPIIMIGWCACLAKFNMQKLLVLVYASLIFSVMCWLDFIVFSQCVWLVVGTSLLLFLPSVKVFSFVKPFVTEIAAAAYFIYLTHMFILHFIDKLTENGPLRYALLVIFCLLAYRLYLKALDVFQNRIKK